MILVLVILLAIALVIGVYFVMIYNALVQVKHNVSKAWANIEVLLKQRHDELPKLIETCKQYMKFEQDTLQRVIEARSRVHAAAQSQDIAALGPAETKQVADLVLELKRQGIGIFLISHDIHDVFDLADRVSVMKNGRLVGTARVEHVTKDEVLGMIILGKCPPGAIPGPGASAHT
jgi:ABC-type Na+ transport system ATPase subunit NatA